MNHGASFIVFLELPPVWLCPQVFYPVLFTWIFKGMMLCERVFVFLQEVAFTGNLWNFKAISKHENHFNVNLKQNCFKKNSSNSYWWGFIKVEFLYGFFYWWECEVTFCFPFCWSLIYDLTLLTTIWPCIPMLSSTSNNPLLLHTE
jgi:hypothetical protein